ncbi:DUF3348 domain-containing protein [Coralloluteibacterium thermophilus]|uniref:DUF3348 domain-containing protein n=1 Tax=Coralloluteibacterium thermophilum TaxID=2707049 RepID=A0ABV9NKS2_9GAMM
MANAAERTTVAGPVFIRLLSRLAEPRPSATGPVLAERLGQWIDWSRAVALSTALDGRLPPAATQVPPFDEDEDAACIRTRATLADAIATDPGFAVPPPGAMPEAGTDFAPFRARYLAHQRAMQAATGRLRGRLRDMLGRRSPALARLAEVDAVMEQTLSPREQALLASVPALLGAHFERLRTAAGNGEAASGTAPTAWLDTFRLDMRGVLLAELDVRFSPIEALLAALRTADRTP